MGRRWVPLREWTAVVAERMEAMVVVDVVAVVVGRFFWRFETKGVEDEV